MIDKTKPKKTKTRSKTSVKPDANFFNNADTYIQKMGAEAQMQRQCVYWIAQAFPYVQCIHIPNGVDASNPLVRYVRKLLGVVSGVPDLLIILPNKKVFYVELKTPTGVVSDAQKLFMEKCVLEVFIIRSFEDFTNLICQKIKEV